MELVERGDRRWVRVLAPAALFAAAFAIRALPFQTVLIEGRTLFFGSDAYYHMRRIVYSIVRFPEVLGFDPYINFPDGAEPIWTPLFDWGIAALLRPLWGHLEPARLEQLAVWVPPLLGAGTVLALYFLARRHFGTVTAVIAGAVLSVMSAHFWYSQVGFIDHHAAVALATTLALAAAMSLLAVSSRTPEGLRPGWKPSVASGFALGGTLLVWPGSLLHVGLVEVAFLVHLLTRSRREDAIGFAWRLLLVHAVAFGLLLPFGMASSWTRWSLFSPVVLSRFQPWFFGAAALFSAGCALGWRRNRAGADATRRFLGAVAIGAALLLASGWLFPELLHSAGDAWEWFAKRDSFQAQVAESSPLFFVAGEFSLIPALQRLSFFALAVPVALVVAYAAVRRDRHRPPVLLFLWWTLGLSVATVIQKRFFNSASVAVSLLLALCIGWTYAALPAGIVRRKGPRRLAKGAIALVTVLLLLPVLGTYWTYAGNQLAHLRGRPLFVDPHIRKQVAVVELANWLRLRTPATSGWLDSSRRPEYAILAPWTIGHVLEYEARRPTVTDNFGDDIGRKSYLLARLYFQSREPEAADLLDRLGARYVVAQFAPNFLGEDPVPGSMFFSLFRYDGSLYDPPPGERERVAAPALERHRLIYESQALAPTAPPGDPLYKVFEYVAGARVVGRAAPGAKIRATLPLRTNRRREFVYTARTTATADGRYELRLPYANTGGSPGIRVAPHYTLACDGVTAEVRIDEPSVTTGAEVAGPSLCLPR